MASPGDLGAWPSPSRRNAALLSGDGTQPGDPAKAAQAILTALDAPDPPLRLVLGGDAVDSIRDRLESLTAELARWEALGRDTALDALSLGFPSSSVISADRNTCDHDPRS